MKARVPSIFTGDDPIVPVFQQSRRLVVNTAGPIGKDLDDRDRLDGHGQLNENLLRKIGMI